MGVGTLDDALQGAFENPSLGRELRFQAPGRGGMSSRRSMSSKQGTGSARVMRYPEMVFLNSAVVAARCSRSRPLEVFVSGA